MRFQFTLADLRKRFPDAPVEGEYAGTIERIASLAEAKEGDLSFLSHARYKSQARLTRASVVLVPSDINDLEPADGQAFVQVGDPSQVLAELCAEIEAAHGRARQTGVHPSAVVDPSADVDPQAWVGPQCVVEAGARISAGCDLRAQVFVGREAVIGEGSVLHAQVVIEDFCQVGRNCILHSGVVIGSDGFGYNSSKEGHRKIPQIGIAVVEDDVEIGANSTVDRARFAETRIGRGSKLDNLVQIGHNVVLGEHCIMCSMSGVAGSSRLGNFVTLGGQVGVVGHIHVGDGAMVGGQAGVSQDLEAGKAYTGTPARELREQRRLEAWIRRLPELDQTLKAMKKQLEQR